MITWEAAKEQIFEMPTGGAAIMRKGPNLLKLGKKEQCLALTTQLRTKFKISPCFYRVFPDGKVEYLHPMDGVYPEKVNAGRVGVNQNMRRIGDNVNPIKVGGGAVLESRFMLGSVSICINASRLRIPTLSRPSLPVWGPPKSERLSISLPKENCIAFRFIMKRGEISQPVCGGGRLEVGRDDFCESAEAYVDHGGSRAFIRTNFVSVIDRFSERDAKLFFFSLFGDLA